MIRRPTGTLGGRWVTSVPYDPSLEMPDEGMTNGRLKGIQSHKARGQSGLQQRLPNWVTTGKSRGRC
jgi:hypothetical protein